MNRWARCTGTPRFLSGRAARPLPGFAAIHPMTARRRGVHGGVMGRSRTSCAHAQPRLDSRRPTTAVQESASPMSAGNRIRSIRRRALRATTGLA
jgi:hypothetical protein